MGRRNRIIDIVRHGLVGPVEVNGVAYNGAMPALEGRFSATQLAAIISYVRGAWGNHGSPVTADMTGAGS